MVVYVSYGSDGRICACTEVEKYAIGMSRAEQVPDEWGQEGTRLLDFAFSDGAISYDPLPRPDPPEYPLEVAREAQATADKAKQMAEQAGTAAASVNEYMDALLGLGATGETEATDAE